ncbi:MAG: hypothetical protein RLZZ344_1150 [Pseudomonadota bacterium]|jgi:hypothetical protein
MKKEAGLYQTTIGVIAVGLSLAVLIGPVLAIDPRRD